MAIETVDVSRVAVKVIEKAKKEVLICLGLGHDDCYKDKGVIDAVKQALERGARVKILIGPDLDIGEIYAFEGVKVYVAPRKPKFTFIVVDKKDIVWQNKDRYGDRVSGSYLRDKFWATIREIIPVEEFGSLVS